MKLCNILFISVSLIFISISCEDHPWKYHSLTFENQSSIGIYIYPALGGSGGIIFPDTTLPAKNTELWLLKPEGRFKISRSKPWSRIIEEMPRDTFSVFFFSSDTVEAYEWEIIRDNYKILERREYGIQDLEKLDFTITYP